MFTWHDCHRLLWDLHGVWHIEMLNKCLWNFFQRPTSLFSGDMSHTSLSPGEGSKKNCCINIAMRSAPCFCHLPWMRRKYGWQRPIQREKRPVPWVRNHNELEAKESWFQFWFLITKLFGCQLPYLQIVKLNCMISKFLPCSQILLQAVFFHSRNTTR